MELYFHTEDTDITTQEKIHWRCMVRCCLAPLQSNIFTNDKVVQVLSDGTHNHNTIVYTNNDLKEIRFRNEAAHESSEHENRVHA